MTITSKLLTEERAGVATLLQRLRGPRPLVCGIVNVTPDSFSDGGSYRDHSAAVAHGLQLADEGADIIDVGGESTRPGAQQPSVAEELERVVPVVEQLSRATSVPVSVDTSRAEVMRAAVEAGAGMINDVRALQHPGAVSAAAQLGVPVCLTHMQGSPGVMQRDPRYADVVDEVVDFLRQRVDECSAAGVPDGFLVVDPGFGFGKTLEHNLDLLASLPVLGRLGLPVMVGLSRKTMLGQITGRPVGHRQSASVTAAVLAAQRGAKILRVHDVAATADALKLLDALTSAEVQR